MQDWRVSVGKNSAYSSAQQHRMTQEQLAFEADLDLTYIGGIERGRRNPSLLAIARIAAALSVSFVKLVSEQ
ncbi:transcriptional regulator with XRE-family HTH domain [Bradyrhizobium sp. LB1.3]